MKRVSEPCRCKEIKEQLRTKLYNSNINLYCDYVGYQWLPKKAANGQLSEPIEWRTDSACGKSFESSLKLPARCNHPNSADVMKNQARCCRFSQCTIDPVCNCQNCQLDVSIDDDYNEPLMNQYSQHIGIVNFFPLMFGLIDDPL